MCFSSKYDCSIKFTVWYYAYSNTYRNIFRFGSSRERFKEIHGFKNVDGSKLKAGTRNVSRMDKTGDVENIKKEWQGINLMFWK